MRDRRIDLLRGTFLTMMVVNHVGLGPRSPLALLIPRPGSWYITGAEGFVALSGYTLGLVYRRRAERSGIGDCARKLLRRAGQLYLAAISIALLEGLVAGITGVRVKTYPLPTEHVSTLHFVLDVTTLHHDYGSTDLLNMFACLMLVGTLIVAFLARRQTRLLLVLSALLYLAQQAMPEVFSGLATLFPLAAVQFLFVCFAVLGWHSEHVSALAKRVPVAPRMWLAAAALLALASSVSTSDSVFARFTLHPQKLAVFAIVAVLAWDAFTLLQDQITAVAGWLLLPLGRNSLVAVLTHYWVVLPSYYWVGRVENQWVIAAYQVAAVWLCWSMARYWESPRGHAHRAAVAARMRLRHPPESGMAVSPGR